LEELGYIKNSPKWTDDCNIIWAYQYSEEKGFDTPHYVIANAFDIPFDKHSRLCGKFIDCGTNEDLFLALAALMDDIDIHQWFTDGNKWFQCRFLKVGMHYSDKPEILFERWHKATVEELIEHFRGKEE
jgi:hypothetical protein